MDGKNLLAVILAVTSSAWISPVEAQEEKPNVLMILSHCLGFSDLGCYGGEIETPNLDQMAADGIRLTNFHNQCSRTPSMVHLISGLDPHRFGAVEGRKKGYLKTIDKTKNEFAHHNLPALFSQHGYNTLISGHTYGWSPGLTGFKEPVGVLKDTMALEWKGGKPPEGRKPTKDDVVYKTEQSSLLLAEKIKEQKEPFFAMFLSRFSMYGLFAKEDDIASFHRRYQRPVSTLAMERYQRLVKKGLVHADWPWVNPIGKEDEGLVGSKNARLFTDADMVKDPDWKVPYG
ncbi:MAG: hypothetical protein CME18_10310, partial [Gemmatimonadetes bacterium]|nr:hypothetical protein [Gemmatimonadota bacterium]